MNTFQTVNKGDLVWRRDRHSADIRFVECIIKDEGINNSVLLVNSKQDLYYEGQQGVDMFNKEWKLCCRKEHLNTD